MRYLAFAGVLAGSFAFAVPASCASTVAFEHGDWSIGCDNTGHCEAVGHQAQDSGPAIAMSIARAAGPGARLRAKLLIPGEDDNPPGEVALQVGRHRVDSVAVEQDLPQAQLSSLLPWMLKEQAVTATYGKQKWRLSLTGLTAVLLKMDEVQGRLGTPGALIRKGSKPEAGVPKAAPVPQLVGAPLPPTTPNDEKLLPRIVKALPDTECAPDLDANLTRLSATKLLVMRQCGLGAYQSSWSLWIVNDRAPFAPAPVKLPMDGTDSGNELTEPDFEDGVLRTYGKGRGLNDCGVWIEWLWTTNGFQLLTWQRAMMCRDILGGVPVSLWVAKAK